jgi:hypothetical protein
MASGGRGKKAVLFTVAALITPKQMNECLHA